MVHVHSGGVYVWYYQERIWMKWLQQAHGMMNLKMTTYLQRHARIQLGFSEEYFTPSNV